LLQAAASTAKQVRDSLQGESVTNIEGSAEQQVRLHFTMFFATQWVLAILVYLDLAVNKVFTNILEHISGLCRTMEKALPKWELFLTDTEFNAELAQEQILENPHRPNFARDHGLLGNLLIDSEEAAKVLRNASFKDMDGFTTTVQLANNLHETVIHYLLIQGALNAVISHGNSQKGPPLAQKVKALNDSPDTKKKLPLTLKVIVDSLAEGDRSSLPALPTSKKKARKATGSSSDVGSSGAPGRGSGPSKAVKESAASSKPAAPALADLAKVKVEAPEPSANPSPNSQPMLVDVDILY